MSVSKNFTFQHATAGFVTSANGHSRHHFKARKVENVIIATIDGSAVSWVNNFDGSSPDQDLSFVPATATAPAISIAAFREFLELDLLLS